MWRFWNNIPRAFRQHVYNPRPSSGRHIEEEQEAAEKCGCPFTGRRGTSDGTGDVRCCSAKVLHRLLNKRTDKDKDRHYAERNQQHGTGKENGGDWWKDCQRDFWKMLERSNRMLEAISVGTAMLWGTDGDKYKRKSKLLYRILFALPGSGTTVKSVNGGVTVTSSNDCTAPASVQMAIKDTAGAERDAAVNLSKTETLDSALEEFQTMCTDYTARSESLLGLLAAEKGDMETAVKHLRSSCMLGNSSACFNLGLCYETGSGVIRNDSKAQHFYKMAAKGGNILALYNLGLMYMNGCDCSNIEENIGAAAADDCGCTKTEGLNLLQKAARLGLAEAQTYLGIHHMEEDQDVAKAVSYFKAAADQNDTEAQYFLGVCYENGWGVEVNECRAAHLYALAASAGHATATYNLAVFNVQGQGGLPEDQATAKDLFEKAAELGSEQAKERLEEMKASQAATDVWQEKINTFHQLYQQYHKDEVSTTLPHNESTSLSPSASFPNLTDYLHKSFSYLLRDLDTNLDKDHQPLFDPGGVNGSDEKRIMFQLGHEDLYDEGSDDVSFKSSADQSFESQTDDSEYFLSPGLRKSRTFPNFSMAACNVCY